MFTNTLLPDTLRAIKLVANFPEVQHAYLAGGTALALQIGHRISADLDFFTQEQFEETVSFESLKLASLADIAAMKIHAIERRGTKRDFVDVYFLSKTYTLEQMLEFYQKKYGVLQDHLYTILRSLDYFEDAEKESDTPKMLTEVKWEEVKEYFRRETSNFTKKKLQN